MWDNNVKGTRQIDSVTSGERVLKIFNFKWHKTGGSDCLTKTQDSAKYNYDV